MVLRVPSVETKGADVKNQQAQCELDQEWVSKFELKYFAAYYVVSLLG